jgi:hypothetical protein
MCDVFDVLDAFVVVNDGCLPGMMACMVYT